MMKNLTLENITKVCDGRYFGCESDLLKEVEGIAIDSRNIEKNWLFIATVGERVDGHSFIGQVMDKGALCAISEKVLADANYNYILVKDSFEAMKQIARFYREQLSIKVVGITGSVGKTSTKEMVASVLSNKYKVLKTSGNFNNEVGLPLTVFNLRDTDEVAVLEMGISDFSEMHRLSSIAKPDICIITNIGECHLENLKSREGVLQAKTEIFDFMNPEGSVILNGEDDMLQTVEMVHFKKPIFFSKTKSDDVKVYADEIVNKGLLGTSCNIHTPHGSFLVSIHIPGEHMINNALAATAAGLELGLSLLEIQKGIEEVKPVDGRSNLLELANFLVIDDCYNANPVSMKAALDLLETAKTRKVAILGDMFELGENSEKLHFEIGSYGANGKADLMLFVGTNAKEMYQGAVAKVKNSQNAFYFATKEELLSVWSSYLQPGDTILLKASHGMQFPVLLEALKSFA